MDPSEILSSPDYVNANTATKRAIFDKHIASTPDYAKANPATQAAIRQRFSLPDEQPAASDTALQMAKGAASAATPTAAAMATGAMIGGGLGAMAGGVGAIPGAALGAAIAPVAMSMSNLAVAGYNAMAQRLGFRPQVPPSVAAQVGAEALGIGQRGAAPVTEALVSGGLGALTGATAAGAAAPALVSPALRETANIMAAQKGLQTAAGALGAAAPAALEANTDIRNPLALTAAGLAAGATVPLGVNALRGAGPAAANLGQTVIAPFVGPTNKLMAAKLGQYGDLNDLAGAVRQGLAEPTLPGAPQRTVAEAAALAGKPNVGLTGLEASLAGANPEAAAASFTRQQQRIAAIQNRIGQIDDAIKTQAGALAPRDAAQLKQVRDALVRELADEQQTLANTAQVAAQPLPNVSQQTVGETIQARGKAQADTIKKKVIEPAYDKAFKADLPEPSINLSAPLATAERLVGDIGAIVDPSKVSPAVRNLLRLEPIPVGDAAPVAPVVSLEDFQSIRAALNKQARASANADPARANALGAVIRQMDSALAASPISAEAKQLYKDANRLVAEVQVPMVRTGETGKMLSRGSYNMPGTLPSKQVEAFLGSEESAAQFVTSLGNDPAALRTMQQGVLDFYRRYVVNPVTRAIDPKRAAKFDQDYARQLDTLEAAGVNVRETMGQVRDAAARVKQAMDALAGEAKKFGKAKSADEVVDLALKSPMDMRFVRDRLTPEARTALSDELIRRATQSIDENNPAAAIKYLTENRKAILAGLGKNAKAYDDALDAARFQKDLADLAKRAPAREAMTPEMVREALKPAEIADLKGLAQQLKREVDLTRQLDEMASATGTKASGARVATELAEQAGTSAKDAPAFFTPIYTAAKNTLRRVQERMDRKTATALADILIRDPQKFIDLAEAAAKAKPSARSQGMSAGAFGASQLQNMMRPQENQNAMAR